MNHHTPGPWVRFTCEGKTAAILPAGRPGDVAVFESVGEADARLIAAAPDLLELAECVVSENPDYGYMHGLAVAAIAKATGAAP